MFGLPSFEWLFSFRSRRPGCGGDAVDSRPDMRHGWNAPSQVHDCTFSTPRVFLVCVYFISLLAAVLGYYVDHHAKNHLLSISPITLVRNTLIFAYISVEAKKNNQPLLPPKTIS